MAEVDPAAPDYVCPLCGPGEYPEGCWHAPGYVGCRACADHHRPPECPVDEQGNAAPPWMDVAAS